MALIEDDDTLDNSTRVGSLFLKRAGDVWRVHHCESDKDGELMTFIDSIYPRAFGSAQQLTRYLLHLDDDDPERVHFHWDTREYGDPTEY